MLHERTVYLALVPAPDEGELAPRSVASRPSDDSLHSVVEQCSRGEVAEAFKACSKRGNIRSCGTRDEAIEHPVQELVVEGGMLLSGSSVLSVNTYRMMKTWVDARSGRKLKIKVGDIEVEATQMRAEDVLRIFELLQQRADGKKILKALMEAEKGGGRPEAH